MVALVEVGDAADVAVLQGAVLDAGVQYPYIAVCDSSDNTTGQHVAVLSKLPLDMVEPTIPGREGYLAELDDPESEDDTGISKGMRVEFQVAGRPLSLYVVHLASERGGHEQDAQRIAQASILRRSYLPRLLAGEMVVVAGDLNDGRGQPTLHRIRGLDDIYPDLVQTGRAEYFAEDDTRWTYEFQGERQQIDHILLSRAVVEALGGKPAARVEPVPDTFPGGHAVSDHRALVVELDFE